MWSIELREIGDQIRAGVILSPLGAIRAEERFAVYAVVDHEAKTIKLSSAPVHEAGDMSTENYLRLVRDQLAAEYNGYRIMNKHDDDLPLGSTFTGSNASDIEDIHDNLLQEADILAVVAKERQLGEPEILLLKGWEKQLRKMALDMANQLSFISQYDMSDYKTK